MKPSDILVLESLPNAAMTLEFLERCQSTETYYSGYALVGNLPGSRAWWYSRLVEA